MSGRRSPISGCAAPPATGALAQVAPTPAADAIPERKTFFKTMLAGKPKPRLALSIETAHALPAGVAVCDEMVRLDGALHRYPLCSALTTAWTTLEYLDGAQGYSCEGSTASISIEGLGAEGAPTSSPRRRAPRPLPAPAAARRRLAAAAH